MFRTLQAGGLCAVDFEKKVSTYNTYYIIYSYYYYYFHYHHYYHHYTLTAVIVDGGTIDMHY